MAPKQDANKKRKLSASGSGARNFDTKLFKSYEHSRRFKKYVEAMRSFVPEKRFELKRGEYPEIQAEIERRGWEKVTTFPKEASLQIVKEFYANAHRFDTQNDDKFISYVRGHTVRFDSDTINTLLKLKTVYHCSYIVRKDCMDNYDEMLTTLGKMGADWVRNLDGTPRKLRAKELHPIARAWSTFVHHTILSCSSVSDITMLTGQLLIAILKGEEINIGNILADHLQETADATKITLNHASLINLLCEKQGVRIKKVEKTHMPTAPITADSIKMYETEPIQAAIPQHPQPEQVPKNQPMAIDQPYHQPAPEPRFMQRIEELFLLQEQRIELIRQNQTRFEARAEEHFAYLRQGHDRLQHRIDYLCRQVDRTSLEVPISEHYASGPSCGASRGTTDPKEQGGEGTEGGDPHHRDF